MNVTLRPIAIALTLMFPAVVTAETPAEKAERMKWFNEARFGMFIHWGLYSVAAGEFKGRPTHKMGEWIQNDLEIHADAYRDELLPKFNPIKYDPEAWVLAAKQAGMKYVVITSKHHDGFALWDSKLTDWDVASSPYGKDLLKPLADACAKHGIRFCVYHSILDWSHPDYGTKKGEWRGNAKNPKPDMDRYEAFMRGQLEELITAYRPGIMWFDGEWEDAWTHERGVALYDWLRGLDPQLIINNRVDKGRKGFEGYTTDAKYQGDYGTPEQQIPATGFGEGVAWESCMTMNETWGYKAQDQKWKSTSVLLRNLIDVASKGGNYLLNVGPTGEGEIPAISMERLAEMGEWMKVNGESIHGTTASLMSTLSWEGRTTTRHRPDGTTRIYVHVFEKPVDGVLTIRGIASKPDAVSVLGGKSAPQWGGEAGAWTVTVADGDWAPIATVVALDFKAKPEIEVVAP